jgi:RNA polymerase sigma-70 factor (ECF subfamily)
MFMIRSVFFVEMAGTGRKMYPVGATRMSPLSANTAISLALGSSMEWVGQDVSLEDKVLSMFDLMRARLLRYAVSFGISVQDGEDIVQETFLALFCHLQQGRCDDNLHGWLFRVTHNLALKRRMKVLKEPAERDMEWIETLDPSPSPEECMLFGERHARMESVLQALSLQDRSCLRLRAEGLRYREIAAALGISLGSVSASLSRSLARLERVDKR